MALSVGNDYSFLTNKTANSAANARADKLSSSLGNIENGEATDEELKAACESFEQYLVEQVIKQAKSSLLEDKDSEGEYMSYFGDTLTEQYAKMITENSNLGIAKMLYESIKKN